MLVFLSLGLQIYKVCNNNKTFGFKKPSSKLKTSCWPHGLCDFLKKKFFRFPRIILPKSCYYSPEKFPWNTQQRGLETVAYKLPLYSKAVIKHQKKHRKQSVRKEMGERENTKEDLIHGKPYSWMQKLSFHVTQLDSIWLQGHIFSRP